MFKMEKESKREKAFKGKTKRKKKMVVRIDEEEKRRIMEKRKQKDAYTVLARVRGILGAFDGRAGIVSHAGGSFL